MTEEEKKAVCKYHIEMMKSYKCKKEVIDFVDSIPFSHQREFYYFLAVDHMEVEEMKKIAASIRNMKNDMQIHQLENERTTHLKKMYKDDAKIIKEMGIANDVLASLKTQCETILSVCTGNVDSMKKVIDKTIEMNGKLEAEKERTIQEKQQIIQELKDEIAQLKTEHKILSNELDRVRNSSKNVRTTSAANTSADSQEKSTGAGEKKGFGTRLKYLFTGVMEDDKEEAARLQREIEKEEEQAHLFLSQYIDNEAYSQEQKDYLIECLEEGISVEDMVKWVSPNLTVQAMKRLRKVYHGRNI